MVSMIDCSLRLSIIEAASPTPPSPGGEEEEEEHYISFSATFITETISETPRQIEFPTPIVPRLQFFAEAQSIVREIMASYHVSAIMVEYDIDVEALVTEIDCTLQYVSAHHSAKVLSLHLCLTCQRLPRDVYERLMLQRAIEMSEASAATEGVQAPADKAVVEALPEVEIDGEEGRDLVCSICLEDLSSSTDNADCKQIVRMPCSHLFDKDCLAQWLNTSHSCPLCRYALPIGRLDQ